MKPNRRADKCESCGKTFIKRRIFYGEDSCWYFAYHHPMMTCYVPVPTMMEKCLEWRLRYRYVDLFSGEGILSDGKQESADELQALIAYIDDQLQKSGFWLQDKEPKECEE